MCLYLHPEELPGLKVGIFQMTISALKSLPIQKLTQFIDEKLLNFEGKKWSCFFHFHTLTWSNEHLKFHFRVKIYFRVNFTKTSFSPLGSEARAKLFTVLITWLGSVNFANLCHSGTSKGFWAVRVPWSEPDHQTSWRRFEIWLWLFEMPRFSCELVCVCMI